MLGTTYTRHQHINPYLNSPHSISLTNVATGCTMLFNRSLIDLALPIPKDALVHDWWLSLVASYFGKLNYLPTPTVLYRQHSNNAIGSRGIGLDYWLKRFSVAIFSKGGSHTQAAINR